MSKINLNMDDAQAGEPPSVPVASPSVLDAMNLAAAIDWDLGTATDTLLHLWDELNLDGEDTYVLLLTLNARCLLRTPGERSAFLRQVQEQEAYEDA